VCKHLIEDGKSASINKTSNDGEIPLKLATDNDRTAVIAYLKSKGVTQSDDSDDDGNV